jgi:ribosomal protein S18 acetylase RimI-like enzyme
MVRIRKARLADCPGLARVQVDSYRKAYAGLFPETYLAQFLYKEQVQDWQTWLTANADDLLLVVVSDTQVIGYLLARAQQDIYPGYDAEILAMHVRRSHQGTGVGRALLREAVEKL